MLTQAFWKRTPCRSMAQGHILGMLRCARRSRALPAGEIPAPVREEPTHRESSLGLMKVTTWVKRRQSDVQAVTQVKRSSLVTRLEPEADRVEHLEGTSRQPQGRWLLETPAGSKSTARTEREASWNLGDPSSSRSGRTGSSMSTEWADLRKTEAAVEVGPADSTPSAGKPRTRGSGGRG